MRPDLNSPKLEQLVVEFTPDRPINDAAHELLRLHTEGVIHVWDVAALSKGLDGEVRRLPVDDDACGAFAIHADAHSGLLGEDDLLLVGSAMEEASVAVVVLYEQRWAMRLVAAVNRDHGQVVAP